MMVLITGLGYVTYVTSPPFKAQVLRVSIVFKNIVPDRLVSHEVHVKITWQKIEYKESCIKKMIEKTRTNDWQNTIRKMFGRRRKAAEDTRYGIDYF